MREIDYNGESLRKDITTIKNKDKKSDIILGQVITLIISMLTTALIVGGIGQIAKVHIDWISSVIGWLVIDSFLGVRNFRRNLEKRKRKVDHATSNIVNLSNNLTNSLNNGKNIVGEIRTQNIIDSVQTKEEVKSKESITVDDNKKAIKKIDTLITHFYMLDTEGKIKVLKEFNKIISSKGNDDVTENELFLLDDDEISQDLPVRRVLRER